MVDHFILNTHVASIRQAIQRIGLICLFYMTPYIVFGQANVDELKGAVILQICENVEWPEYKQDEFVIGFLSNDQQVYKALKTIETSLKIKKMTVKILNENTFEELLHCNAVYFNKYSINNIGQVFEQARENNILLITDNYEDPLNVHVNLMQDGSRMAFKINMANLTLAKLTIKPNILLNGGSVVDIKTAFEQFDTKLKEGRDKLLLSEKALLQKEEMLQMKDSLIVQKESVMERYAFEIDSLSDETKMRARLAEKQKIALQQKELEINTKNTQLGRIYQDIENKQVELNDLKSNIAEYQEQASLFKGEINQKNKVLSEKDELINTQRRLMLVFIGMFVGFMLAAFTILRLFFIKRKLNFELQSTNDELQDAIEELNTKNEIINGQNSELSATLEHLKKTQAQLIQAEKMASLGVLTAGVSHEINNPLNYLSGTYFGFVNYFEKHGTNDEQTTNLLLSSTETAINRISAIVNGLNQFSADNSSYDEDCDLHIIIENCLTVLYNQYKNKVEINKDFCSQISSIKGNIGKLHQVFISVISNSIQSIEKKGQISIKTLCIGKYFEIEISDTGCGISKENLTKITDPFFTTKPPGEGTGLGLSVSYSIIKEHQGTLKFESEIEKGTKAIIKFPINKN